MMRTFDASMPAAMLPKARALWNRIARTRRSGSFFYLLAFVDEGSAPVELRRPFGTTDGLRTWHPRGRAIDDLHLGASALVVAAETKMRRLDWERLPACLLLSTLDDGNAEPEVVFFKLAEWRQFYVD